MESHSKRLVQPMRKALVPALQLLGAIAFAGILIAVAASNVDMRVVVVVWWTAITFGFLVYYTRDLRRSWAYWVILSCALPLHVLGLAKLETSGAQITALGYTLISLVEFAVLLFVLLAVADRGPRSS